jgi:ParB family chromosome partitioning protein
MKTQKLGRGLDALLGEMDEAYAKEGSSSDSIIDIPLKDIRPNPYQPRKTFDENALHELSESIKNDGLIQPIVVTTDVDGYIIIAGERRFRASKLAKLKTIRAIILNSDEQKMRQYALIENIQREELNSIELAIAYNQLIKLYEITQEELSTRIFKSRTHITNTIRLLQLSEKTQKALVEKKITAGHAKVLVGLNEKTQNKIVNSTIGQKLSVREVEAVVKNMKETNTEPRKKVKVKAYNFTKIKEKISKLGFRVKTSNKTLTLEFDNQNQVDDFLNYLSNL